MLDSSESEFTGDLDGFGIRQRQHARDSIFLMTSIEVEGRNTPIKGRVRNISDGGMLVESDERLAQGTRISCELRQIGKVGGTVAWCNSQSFGVAFDQYIDAQAVRKPVVANKELPPRFIRPITAINRSANSPGQYSR